MTIVETLAEIRVLAEAEKCTTEHFAPSIEVISVPGGLYPVPCEQADCTGLNPAYAPLLNVGRRQVPDWKAQALHPTPQPPRPTPTPPAS